ncbi:MAG: EAL domain-containing protein [Myxococcales bacterium]|nr:EAL domain-containing protein [Myxococcales bacterium]
MGNQELPDEVPDQAAGRVRERQKFKVLCVDDETLNLDLLDRALRRGFEVLLASSPERAITLLRENSDIAVVVTDYRMPGMTGAELLAASAKLRPDARRIVVTGYADTDNILASVNNGGAQYVLRKPWKNQDLVTMIDHLVSAYEREHGGKELVNQLRLANQKFERHEERLIQALDDRTHDLDLAQAELDRIVKQQEALSFRDQLTGLYTHRAFLERLEEECARCRRHPEAFSVLMVAVDGLPSINQEFGYAVGDEYLRRIAKVLGSADPTSRLSDITARYSGEEFVLLLPSTAKPGATTKALKIRESIAHAEFPTERKVTVSVGIASFAEDADNSEGLIASAKSALRAAKAMGPGRVRAHTRDEPGGATHLLDNAVPVAVDVAAAAPLSSVLVRMVEEDHLRPYHERIAEISLMLQRGRALSCLYVDLRGLQRIETDLGVAHHAQVYETAGRVLFELREGLLGRGDVICRTTDDDAYIVFLEPRNGMASDGAEALALALEAAVESALTPSVRKLLHDVPRTVVGVARVLGNSMLRPERLIARVVTEAADTARLARERRAVREKAMLQDIILSDGLTPVYQPIAHLETGEIFGFEALTRGPKGTPLESPATLFSIADEVDLTFELDRACFRGALRGAATLEPVHRLFVNLLPVSYYDSAFIKAEVSALLEMGAVTPANIVFEITEKLAIENFSSFKRALANYTAMGFGVAIDDVGTRHSNLETVMALRPNFIKLSDVLTRGVANSTVKREMVRSLNRIADAIDSVLVAEGIETADDLLVLRDLGVKFGQGFFLARPGPAFPKLTPSVKRAIRSQVEQRVVIAAPPAEFDEHGDVDMDISRESQLPAGFAASVEDDSRATGDLSTIADQIMARARRVSSNSGIVETAEEDRTLNGKTALRLVVPPVDDEGDAS